MTDERIMEVVAEALYEGRDGPKNRGHPEGFAILYGAWASRILAALRAEGYDLYRPDECRLVPYPDDDGFWGAYV